MDAEPCTIVHGSKHMKYSLTFRITSIVDFIGLGAFTLNAFPPINFVLYSPNDCKLYPPINCVFGIPLELKLVN